MKNEDIVVYTYMKSPHGSILLARREAGLTRISFQKGKKAVGPGDDWLKDDAPLVEATVQLRAYFYGELRSFDLPLSPQGTSFQLRVWRALQSIPCGEVTSYGEIAKQIGNPKAVRAVGAANGKNPLPIVIPCHRVIGASGKLVGYAGGLKIKEALLLHEQEIAPTKNAQLLIA